MAPKTKAEKVAAAAVAAAMGTDKVDLEDLPDEEADVADALAQLRELDGDNVAHWEVTCVKKSPPDPEAEGFIETIDTANLNRDYFRNSYGPGKYRVMGRVAGRYVKGSHKLVTISTVKTAARAAASPAGDPVNLLTQLEQQRLAREDADRKARSERMKDWAGIVGAIGLGPMVAAFIARKSAFDPVALMVAMQSNQLKLADVLPLLQSRSTAEAPQLEAVFKVLDVLQDKMGGQGESNWIDLARDTIREIIPAAKPILENLAQQQQQRQQSASQPIVLPPTQPLLPPAPAAAPPSNGAAAAPPTEADMLSLIKPFLVKRCEDLLEWARENRNIELCAEWLLESIPKIYRAQVTPEQLKEWLTRPDWWPLLAGFYPQLQPYQAWIDEVRQEVVAMLDAELAGSPEPPPQDATHVN